MNIKSFTFNPFSENTYILFDDTKECIIIDPGCSDQSEQKVISEFISNKQLKPVKLINTHCHIDHILGNQFIANKYSLSLTAHKKEAPVLAFGTQTAMMYQIPYDTSPDIELFIDEGEEVMFGHSSLKVLFTPGHSPASISLLSLDDKILIAGDVLFQGSIGRTDLPGGNFETLTRVIKSKYFILPDDIIVYPGHGDPTTIGVEKRTNPFLK
ncbi:MAG: MBL fold metallo-hydrolase [Saprospiraceae bacterium]|jgi:glyoxylase-like metal-dependent hydrolase (beta-lactamase superfamily II)|nr:MBL fold metallo-hydrolase [Saprospiraceae bacterium]MBL0025907.1 MBL fold metallo-hydrolase [Saprospiraceae bacterium]